MRLVKASATIETPVDVINDMYKALEKIGRTCYKSEDRITDSSAQDFVLMLASRGHHAMLEHASVTVRFICDRGVSHEIVRHRIAAYAQESTRYCDYSKDKFNNGVTYVLPLWFEYDAQVYMDYIDNLGKNSKEGLTHLNGNEINWLECMQCTETTYLNLLASGWDAQKARSVLPNALKTEIVMTANLREWMHFLTLRTASAAHPQMREIALPLLVQFRKLFPGLYYHIPLNEAMFEFIGRERKSIEISDN